MICVNFRGKTLHWDSYPDVLVQERLAWSAGKAVEVAATSRPKGGPTGKMQTAQSNSANATVAVGIPTDCF